MSHIYRECQRLGHEWEFGVGGGFCVHCGEEHNPARDGPAPTLIVTYPDEARIADAVFLIRDAREQIHSIDRKTARAATSKLDQALAKLTGAKSA